MYGEVEVYLHAFLISALGEGEWPASRPGLFTPGRRAHWTEGWVSPRAGLDAVAKRKNPCPCRELNPGRPACSLVIMLSELPRLLLEDDVLILRQYSGTFLKGKMSVNIVGRLVAIRTRDLPNMKHESEPLNREVQCIQ
jgi:hypothetical protein